VGTPPVSYSIGSEFAEVMTAQAPPFVVERPKVGQGWGGVHPPIVGGGGDGGPDDGFPDYERRMHRARLALILGVVSISMLFVTLTAIFFLRQATVVLDHQSGRYVREWAPIELPVQLLLFNTLVLLVSSATMELARRSVAREMALAPVARISGIAIDKELRFPWVAVTVALGLLFLMGQWRAWEALQTLGFHVSTTGATPFFYLLTGAHAVHLAVGILILLYAGVISFLRERLEHRRIVVEVTSWYWHFMGILWVYVFALLEFGR
jgi:cytochrome c oxidase subunit 3